MQVSCCWSIEASSCCLPTVGPTFWNKHFKPLWIRVSLPSSQFGSNGWSFRETGSIGRALSSDVEYHSAVSPCMSSAYLFEYCNICLLPASTELLSEQVLLASAPWPACAGIYRLRSGHDSTGRRASRVIQTASWHLFSGLRDWQRKTTSAWEVLGLSSRTISSVAGHQGVPPSAGVRRMSPSLLLLPQLSSQPVQLRPLI